MSPDGSTCPPRRPFPARRAPRSPARAAEVVGADDHRRGRARSRSASPRLRCSFPSHFAKRCWPPGPRSRQLSTPEALARLPQDRPQLRPAAQEPAAPEARRRREEVLPTQHTVPPIPASSPRKGPNSELCGDHRVFFTHIPPRSTVWSVSNTMTLSAGARLGPYGIVSAIGAGGGGGLSRARYAARSDVAIKVLRASRPFRRLGSDGSRERRGPSRR